VCIPGAGGRACSYGDLRAYGGAAAAAGAALAGLAARHARPWGLAKAPASAPAAPAMMPASPPQAGSRGGDGGGGGFAGLGLPPPPPPLAAVPSGGSESGSSAASSGLPASCSPQLPFAFTPSAASTYSLSSLVGPVRRPRAGDKRVVAQVLEFVPGRARMPSL